MATSQQPGDISMADVSLVSTSSDKSKDSKSKELFTCTIGKPSYGYACLELVTDSSEPAELDALQVRSHCTAALKQFLGASGAAIPIDILKVQGMECWIRVPREDLAPFTAAIAAWPVVSRDGNTSLLQLQASGNWLGSLIDRSEQRKLWNS